MNYKLLNIIVIIANVLLISACGGSNDEPTTNTNPESEVEVEPIEPGGGGDNGNATDPVEVSVKVATEKLMITPVLIYKDEPTEVRFEVYLDSAPTGTLDLVRIDPEGDDFIVGSLVNDGTQGDAVANDNIYTFSNVQTVSTIETQIYQVQINEADDPLSRATKAQNVHVVKKPFIKQPDPNAMVSDGFSSFPVNQITVQLSDANNDEVTANKVAESINGMVVGYLPIIDLYLIETPSATIQELNELQQVLENDPLVKTTVKNYLLAAAEVENDMTQLEMNNGSKVIPYQKIGVFDMWQLMDDANAPSTMIKIGIVDSGISQSHPEFDNSSIVGLQVANNDGHGTAVASIIAAENDASGHVDNMNGIMTGLPGSDRVQLVSPSSSLTHFSTLYGIHQSVKLGASVINLSLGSTLFLSNPPANQDGVITNQKDFDKRKEAYELFFKTYDHVLFVASAGNESIDARFNLPGGSIRLDNLLTVAATDNNDEPTGFTNYGAVDIAAPGHQIHTASVYTQNLYAQVDGTSFSAPMVTAVAGMLLSINPNLTPKQLRDLLLKNADYIESNSKNVSGRRLNGAESVRDLLNQDDFVIWTNSKGNQLLRFVDNAWQLRDYTLQSSLLEDVPSHVVDWRGHFVNGKPTRRLYWNANSRYESGGFSKQIYKGRRLFAEAPKPVMGATIQIDSEGDEWLLAICINAETNEFELYSRPLLGDNQNLEAIEAMVNHPELEWNLVGTQIIPANYKIDRPWKINGNGKKAVTIAAKNNEERFEKTDEAHLDLSLDTFKLTIVESNNGRLQGEKSWKDNPQCEDLGNGDFKGTYHREEELSGSGRHLAAIDYKNLELERAIVEFEEEQRFKAKHFSSDQDDIRAVSHQESEDYTYKETLLAFGNSYVLFGQSWDQDVDVSSSGQWDIKLNGVVTYTGHYEYTNVLYLDLRYDHIILGYGISEEQNNFDYEDGVRLANLNYKDYVDIMVSTNGKNTVVDKDFINESKQSSSEAWPSTAFTNMHNKLCKTTPLSYNDVGTESIDKSLHSPYSFIPFKTIQHAIDLDGNVFMKLDEFLTLDRYDGLQKTQYHYLSNGDIKQIIGEESVQVYGTMR